MADYRILYADTATGTLLGELPVSSFSFSEGLNGAGSFSASMPLVTSTEATLSLSVGRPELTAANFQPDGRTQIFVERDGSLVWGGMLWGFTADMGKQTAKISATGFLGYFMRRLIVADATYAATEQTAIAWGLINTAQAASSIGVVDGSTATGTVRDRAYEGVYATPVGEALQNLTRLNGGFDMRIRSYWSGGSIVKSFETSFPQSGRTTAIVLDLASNLSKLSLTEKGTEVNTLAYASGQPGVALQSTANATLELSVPRLEAIEAHTSVSETAALLAHSARLSQRGSTAVRTMRAEVAPGYAPGVGGFVTGDVVAVRAVVGWLDVSGNYRVSGYSVGVDDAGTEKVQLDLATSGAF